MSVWKNVQLNGKAYFKKHGYPSKQMEEWKYTSVKSIQETTWKPALEQKKPAAPIEKQLQVHLNSHFYNLVFINGQYSERLSSAKIPNAEVEILDIGRPTKLAEEVVVNFAKKRQKVQNIRQDSFEALNATDLSCGVLIKVPKGQIVGRPLQVLHILSGNQVASSPRVQLILEPGSELCLLETYLSDSTKTWTNSVIEASVGRNSQLEYVRLQSEGSLASNIGTSRIYLEKDSQFWGLSYTTGGQLSRHNFDVHCLEEGSFAQVNGVSLLSGSQHSDHHTWIDHLVGHCTTTQLYKNILDEKARSVFNGKVLIHQDAQKASSEQLNNNLLLSTQAEADSKPELQIYADDVKATHGSTVGQLNNDEIFYFMSRGISRAKALEILSLGFVNDVISKVRSPKVRAHLEWLLEQTYAQFKGTLS